MGGGGGCLNAISVKHGLQEYTENPNKAQDMTSNIDLLLMVQHVLPIQEDQEGKCTQITSCIVPIVLEHGNYCHHQPHHNGVNELKQIKGHKIQNLYFHLNISTFKFTSSSVQYNVFNKFYERFLHKSTKTNRTINKHDSIISLQRLSLCGNNWRSFTKAFSKFPMRNMIFLHNSQHTKSQSNEAVQYKITPTPLSDCRWRSWLIHSFIRYIMKPLTMKLSASRTIMAMPTSAAWPTLRKQNK